MPDNPNDESLAEARIMVALTPQGIAIRNVARALAERDARIENATSVLLTVARRLESGDQLPYTPVELAQCALKNRRVKE